MAVLAVFGYHLGYRQLRSGFLGVDVFFVLSGFLITTVLAAEHRGMQEIARSFVGAGTRLGFVALPPVVTPPDCLREDTQDLGICAIPASRDRNVEMYNEMLAEIASD